VNIHGQVIGINSAIASSNGRYQGYGFAIPISLAKRVMDDLIQYGGVRRAMLGVSIDSVTPADAKAAGVSAISGVKINGFNPTDDSPAQRAGLEPGDIIVAVDGRPIDRMSTLQRVIREYKPGQTVSLDIVRFGDKKKIAVKLAEPPKTTQAAVASNDTEEAPRKPLDATPADKLGISVAPVPVELVKQDTVPASYQHGLLVTNVRTSGPGYRSFATNSDIIVRSMLPKKQEIKTAADLQDLLKLAKKGDTVSLLIYNADSRQTRVVNLTLP
jgi:serine protease Do